MNGLTLSLVGSATILSSPAAFGQLEATHRRDTDRSIPSRPSWATPERLRGHVDGSTPIMIQIHLPLRALEAAKAGLEAMSDRDSPRYCRYLTSEQFGSKYSLTAEDLATVRSYFESEDVSITYVPRNRQFVNVRPAAADVERVFATRLGYYRPRCFASGPEIAFGRASYRRREKIAPLRINK